MIPAGEANQTEERTHGKPHPIFEKVKSRLPRKPSTRLISTIMLLVAVVIVVVAARANPAQDRYTLKVPGGLAFSEFKGYESWQLISISQDGPLVAAILGNPTMIKAFEDGIPGNGKPFPEGAKMAKIHWTPTKMTIFPSATVPGAQHDVDFMEKDSKKFADSGGWGYAVFEYDATSKTFHPGTTSDTPPQSNDAKCGATCHTAAKAQDYVFTAFAGR
jgi:hypothetical protein